jgi:Ca2+-binding EF-hand superfamily protein
MRKLTMLMAALVVPALPGATEEVGPGIIDADGDGVVTREEFGVFRRARAFANDADGDGVLDLDEFRAVIPERVPRMMHGRVFSRVDANGDDLVSVEELDAMPARAFDQADADGDGRLTAEEREALSAQ